MTKDAKTMLCCIYNIYKEQLKSKSRELSKEMNEDIICEKCSKIFNSEDVPDLIYELQTENYLYTDICGGVYLENSGIEFIENLPKNEFKNLLDLISKFF